MNREVIKKQILVDDSPEYYRIWEIESYDEFGGCQCFGDCSCAEYFNSEHKHYFKCTKLRRKVKTFFKSSLYDCYVELVKRNVIKKVPSKKH